MSTSDAEEDLTPDLEELESENDDERSTLSQILQKLSDCEAEWCVNQSNLELI